MFGSCVLRGFATAGAFDPLQLSGLVFYANADKGTTIATGVSQWNDLSGQGNHATQATGGSQPSLVTNWRNGRNALQGANGKSLVRSSFTGGAISQPCTIFVVGSWSASNVVLMVDGSFASNRVAVGRTSGGLWSLSHGSVSNGIGTSNTSDVPFYALSEFASPESGSSAWVKALGKSEETGTIDPDGSAQTMTGVTIGATYVPSNHWDGKIASVVIVNRVLTAAEKAQLKSWAASYYAIT